MAPPPRILLDTRDRKRYEYTRWFYSQEKNQWTIVEVIGDEFGNVFVPDHYNFFFRKVFAKGNKRNISSTMEESLHHARKHEKAYTITITRAWQEPVSFKPLKFAPEAKKKTSYILLDAESMVAFMNTLPSYVDDIIPSMKEQAENKDDVSQMSEYSTFTTTSQVRGSCTLKVFQSTAQLDLSLVQFVSSTFGLDLRYHMDGSTQGLYFNGMVLSWLMEERSKILDTAQLLKTGGIWHSVAADYRRNCKLEMADADVDIEDVEEVEGGGAKKHAKLVPVADDDDHPSVVVPAAPAAVPTTDEIVTEAAPAVVVSSA
jgi:hypothetical protein